MGYLLVPRLYHVPNTVLSLVVEFVQLVPHLLGPLALYLCHLALQLMVHQILCVGLGEEICDLFLEELRSFRIDGDVVLHPCLHVHVFTEYRSWSFCRDSKVNSSQSILI